MKNKNKKYGDNLVLSRNLFGLRKVEGALIKLNIPYMVFGGTGLFQSRHVRDLVSAIRIVGNYLDEIAWIRYLKLWRNIGDVSAAQILDVVIKEKSLEDCLMKLMEIIVARGLSDAIYNTLIAISNLQDNPSKAIQSAFNHMESRLEEIYQSEHWDTRKEDFPVLEDVAKSSTSINEFVAEYILNPTLESMKKDTGLKEDSVILSTIHSAKGLEAHIVYLVNASSWSFPTPRAILNGEDAVEEERRCLYVALTRAKDELRIYRNH